MLCVAQQPQGAQTQAKPPVDDISARPVPISDAYYEGFTVGKDATYAMKPRVLIYRSADNTPTIYHHPVLMFMKPEETVPGYPEAVWEVEPADGGMIRLVFRVQTTSKELRAKVRDAFSSSPRGKKIMKEEWKIESADDLAIEVNSFDGLLIECKKGNEVLARYRANSLQSLGTVFPFELEFSPETLKTFLENTMGGKDRIKFEATVSTAAAGVEEGKLETLGTVDIRKEVGNTLSSMQLDPNKPIFQETLNDVLAKSKSTMMKNVYVTDPSLFVMLNSMDSVAVGIFASREMTFDDLKADPQLLARFYEYIKPHLQTLRLIDGIEVIDETSGSDTTLTDSTHENSKIKIKIDSKKLDPDTGFTYAGTGGYGRGIGKASTTSNEERVSDIQRNSQEKFEDWLKQTGTQWQKTGTDEYYRPHNICVHTLQQGNEENKVEEKFTVFIQMDNYFKDETITGTPLSLTAQTFTKEEKTADGDDQLPASVGVPIGTIVPYMGGPLPAGWVEIKEKNKFPNTPHFPEHLRNQSMPDMTNRVFMGTPTLADVGKKVTPEAKMLEGEIIPAYTIGKYDAPITGIEKSKVTVAAEHPTIYTFHKLIRPYVDKKWAQGPADLLDAFVGEWINGDRLYTFRYGWTKGKRIARYITQNNATSHAEIDFAAAVKNKDNAIAAMHYAWEATHPFEAWSVFPQNTDFVLPTNTDKAVAKIRDVTIPEITPQTTVTSADVTELLPAVKVRWIIKVR